MKRLLMMLLACAPLASFAQSSLTIFSEDGYPFYLILNGQRQNTNPVTNIHIDGLTAPQYAVKIIFDDKTKKEISKNLPVTDPGTNAFADVTYKIKTQKDGDIKMRYFSATPVVPNYVPPPDMYVMHYGQPAPPPPPPPGGVSQTTVTRTTTTSTDMGMGGPGNASFSVGVGVGGVNMNVNISDPTMNSGGTTTTTRTTTRTTTTGGGGYYQDAPPPAQPVYGNNNRGNGGCNNAMPMGDFNAAKQTIQKASFEDTKLSTAKTVLSTNCMSTEQVMQICKLFSFEESKLDFAKYAYDRCPDRGNYFKVGNIFSFDASRTELNEYISGH
jgi:hypothetical protein